MLRESSENRKDSRKNQTFFLGVETPLSPDTEPEQKTGANPFIPTSHPHTDSASPKLKDDCWICQTLHQPGYLVVRETRTSVAKLNPDQLFPGYTFVTLKWHEEHFTNLSPREQRRFLEDMTTLANTLTKALKPDRMNYELLGNAQPHLHWHLIPRYATDPMWGRPVWAGNRRRKRLTEDVYRELVSKLKDTLTKGTDTNEPGSE